MTLIWQSWQGRWEALTSTLRPAPQGKISAPLPVPPSAPGLAWASVDPSDLICLLENRVWRSAPRACSIACLLAHIRAPR